MARTLWMLTTGNHTGREGPRQLYSTATTAKAVGMGVAEQMLDSSFTGTMLDHELESMTWQLDGDTWQLMVGGLTDLFVYPMTLAED